MQIKEFRHLKTFGKNDTYVLMVPNGDVEAEQDFSDSLQGIPEITSILSYVDTVGAEIPKEYLDSNTLSQLGRFLGRGTLLSMTSVFFVLPGLLYMLDGIKEFYDGISELKDGTAEMRLKTDGMDGQITETIDGMLESITGGSGEVVSFISLKNTNVKLVQFVIQTEKIEIAEVESDTNAVKEKLTFWQKILRLFGLY